MIPDVLNMGANLIIAASAATASVAAVRGLNTWKNQREWEERRRLALNLAVAFYKRRDAVRHVRNLFGWSDETDFDNPNVTDQEKEWYGVSSKYRKRLEKIVEANQEAYPVNIEAEFVFGPDFKAIEGAVRGLEMELFFAVEDHVASFQPRSGELRGFESDEARKRNDRIIHGTWSEKDEFGTRYTKAFDAVIEFIRWKAEGEK